jgi:hypothetical protein
MAAFLLGRDFGRGMFVESLAASRRELQGDPFALSVRRRIAYDENRRGGAG